MINKLEFKIHRLGGGFSLVELVVIIGIFTMISSIILANYPTFNHRISLQNLAGQIALEVRQAQVFGLSVREASAGSNRFPAYGVYFSKDDAQSFILFTDILNGDRKYNGSGECSISEECVEKTSIVNGDSIKDFCVYDRNNNKKCVVEQNPAGQIEYLNIIFVRPDPDANIIGTYLGEDTVYQKAEILIEPPKKDFTKKIEVWNTGQISID